ncbi:protein gp37 [Cohnella sp. OV330]|uniref:DUF5131 family protein n=1 Tax=Cohnella sp. OV330 TaxID=1855288 RepID=UPI0008E2B8FC|nr:phage Gp37/Gp68 family protein [Cohnella sp. OV330]SFA90876.1 protein gp37 [Cohnella sp. OV330]
MSDKSKIEWTDATWNPVTGCTKVSEGCRNCYALTFAERWRGTAGHYFEKGFDIVMRPDKLLEPVRWRRPRKVFVNSMSDLFHREIPQDYIDKVFAVMALAPQHEFQLLTKRPERMLHYFQGLEKRGARQLLADAAEAITGDENAGIFVANRIGAGASSKPGWPLKNVWLGVSVENHKAADERIPLLIQTPAAVRWLSCEPLIGPVDLSKWLMTPGWTPTYYDPDNIHGYPNSEPTNEFINWVVVGGESGHKARPMHLAWARSLRDQCQAAGVPFLFKQWGEWTPGMNFPDFIPSSISASDMGFGNDLNNVWRVGKKAAGRELDGRTWDEYPEVRV